MYLKAIDSILGSLLKKLHVCKLLQLAFYLVT